MNPFCKYLLILLTGIWAVVPLQMETARAEDPFSILGVPSGCSIEEARIAWKKWHVQNSLNGGYPDQELAKKINNAMDIIAKGPEEPKVLRLNGPKMKRPFRVPGLGTALTFGLDVAAAVDPWNDPLDNLNSVFSPQRDCFRPALSKEEITTQRMTAPLVAAGSAIDLTYIAAFEAPYRNFFDPLNGFDQAMTERGFNTRQQRQDDFYRELQLDLRMEQSQVIINERVRRLREAHRNWAQELAQSDPERYVSSELYKGVYGARKIEGGVLDGLPDVYERNKQTGCPDRPYDPAHPKNSDQGWKELPQDALFYRMNLSISRLWQSVEYRRSHSTQQWYFRFGGGGSSGGDSPYTGSTCR
jgi:hypothetical protein